MKTKLCKCLRPWKLFASDKPKVAVIRLHGVISKDSGFKKGLYLDAISDQLTKAFKIKQVKAVALQINSPGGSPVQTEQIYRMIRFLAKKYEVPVYSFVEDVAASGGYWLACSGDKIYASASSIVGSIGVISASFGFAETIKKLGIERRVYTQGENKSILDPFAKEKSSDVAILLKAQAHVHAQFKALVEDRRGHAIEGQDKDTLFSGMFWAGVDAKSLGLIDEIGTMQDVLVQMYGEDVELVKIGLPSGFLKRKLGLQPLHIQLADHLSSMLEEKAYWGRYGL